MEIQRDSAGRLSPAACLDLLRTTAVGRIAYSDRALPAILTVHFLIIDDAIVLGVENGSRRLALLRDAVVAFQADHIDPVTLRGWSVSCVGKAEPVDEPELIAGAEAIGWPQEAAEALTLLRIRPELLQGRRYEPSAAESVLPSARVRSTGAPAR